MHASISGHAAEYYQLRRGLGPVDPAFDRISILGKHIERSWHLLQEIVAEFSKTSDQISKSFLAYFLSQARTSPSQMVTAPQLTVDWETAAYGL